MHRNCKNAVSRRVTPGFSCRKRTKHLAGHNHVNSNGSVHKREGKIGGNNVENCYIGRIYGKPGRFELGRF